MQSDRSHIELLYVDIKGQSGTNDCGLYALAFATSVCYGNKPETVFYHQHEMRAHLLHCIENKCLTEYPHEARENYQLPFGITASYLSEEDVSYYWYNILTWPYFELVIFVDGLSIPKVASHL